MAIATEHKQEANLAAIDLGSNSFHMIVVHHADGQVRVLDRLRESVRLGSGLNAKGELSKPVRERALACLQRFGERLRDLPSTAVAAVGTNTLRQASQARDFLEQAEVALGHPIAVISGHEEARLIYLGVAHSLEQDDVAANRLVMDIGGGSTELIIGQGFEAKHLESLKMGCVSSSLKFFPDGRLDKACWKRAITSARLHLMPIAQRYLKLGWDTATGASGTIKAVRKVIQRNNLSPYGITLDDMYQVREWMIAAGHLDKLKLSGLSDERKPVFAGGLAILIATFEALQIEQMRLSDGALREGLIYDRLQRFQREDIRNKTVRGLQQRFEVDAEHALTVRATAENLFALCQTRWGLQSAMLELLCWAAELYEIGLVISHKDYQKHGAYLLDNVDMPGFSTEEQHWLSTLVRTHRAKLSPKLFNLLDEKVQFQAIRVSVLLRLAILLHRARQDSVPDVSQFKVKTDALEVRFRALNLAEERPLLLADLERERDYLENVDFSLKL